MAEKPEIINPPNLLKAKVGRVEGPPALDLEALERAEAVIANLQDSYLDWVQEDLAKLADVVEKSRNDPANLKQYADEVFRISHDVKGQGGSFGYQLITLIGNQLCRFLEKLDEPTPAHMEVVKLHVDTMKLVIAKRIQGDGGPLGAQLVDGLNKVIAKIGAR